MRKIKWYNSRDAENGTIYWWTQRDRNGNSFEIRQRLLSKRFRLFANEIKRSDHDSLIEAQRAARDLWVE